MTSHVRLLSKVCLHHSRIWNLSSLCCGNAVYIFLDIKRKDPQVLPCLVIGVLVARRCDDILAEAFVEFVEAFQLARNKRQVIRGQSHASPHHHNLGIEIVHHKPEEAICHPVPFASLVASQFLARVLQLVAHRRHQRIHCADFFDLQFLDLALQDFGRARKLACNLAMRHKLNSQALANRTSNQVRQRSIAFAVFHQQLGHERPGARCRKRAARATRVKVEQRLFREAVEANHVFVDAVVDSPRMPRIKVDAQFQVDKTVCQRSRHAVSNALVRLTVASSNDHHVVGQFIRSNAPVQDQLVCCGLYGRSSGVHFVQEQDDNRPLGSKFFAREFNRGSPGHNAQVFVEVRDTTQVRRLHRRHTQVDRSAFHFASNAGNQFRLANAHRSPQEHRTLGFEAAEYGTPGFDCSDCSVLIYGSCHVLCSEVLNYNKMIIQSFALRVNLFLQDVCFGYFLGFGTDKSKQIPPLHVFFDVQGFHFLHFVVFLALIAADEYHIQLQLIIN